MKRNFLITKLSLLVILGGGMMLSTPAPAAAAGATLDCRETVTDFCQWIADNFCTKGARCIYEIATCTVTDVRCTDNMT